MYKSIFLFRQYYHCKYYEYYDMTRSLFPTNCKLHMQIPVKKKWSVTK